VVDANGDTGTKSRDAPLRRMRWRFPVRPSVVALLLTRLPTAGASQTCEGYENSEISHNLREHVPIDRRAHPLGRFPRT